MCENASGEGGGMAFPMRAGQPSTKTEDSAKEATFAPPSRLQNGPRSSIDEAVMKQSLDDAICVATGGLSEEMGDLSSVASIGRGVSWCFFD
jgi:hypothetical protein